MEIDQRPKYVWYIVIAINIGTVLFILLAFFEDLMRHGNKNPVAYILDVISNPIIAIALGISLVYTVVPILLSKSTNKLVRALGYGIPVLLLVPVPYFIYDYYTCTGKLCELGPFLYGWACGLSAIILSIFYTLGNKVTTWTIKTYQRIFWVEILLLLAGIVIFFADLIN